MIFGLIKMAGLRLMGGIFGAWIDPLVRMTMFAVAGVGVALLVAGLWPSGKGQIERAALDAIAAREQIVRANTDEEKRDNAWVEERQRWLRAARDVANADSGVVLWPADNGWLRKHTSSR